MRSVDSAVQAAREARRLVEREFIWIEAKNRETGETESVGFVSDINDITASVVDGFTRSTVERSFVGAGSLISIGDIETANDNNYRSVEITLSPLNDDIAQAIRGYDPRQCHIQVYSGTFDPDTNVLIAPAEPIFVGRIDEAPITTGAEGDVSQITLTCRTDAQELDRASTAKRSNENQALRSATDTFFKYVTIMDSITIPWGEKWSAIKSNKAS
jgi:hypothetical protein